MLKVEGENRIYLESIVEDIAEKYGVPINKALKFLCMAIQYNVVMEQILEQIDYLLEHGEISKD